MYRALYDYKTELKNYLAFETGDQFTIIDQKQKDWYLAQNGYGEIGYIPKNYVLREEVGQSEVLTSIDRAIEVIHYQAGSKGGQYTHAQRENLSKLIQHRKSVVDNYKDQVETSAPTVTQTRPVQVESVQLRNKSTRRVAPTPPSRISSVENKPRESLVTDNKANSRTSTSSDKPVTVNSAQIDIQDGGHQPSCRDSRETVNSASSPINIPPMETVSKEVKCDHSGLIDVSAIHFPEGIGNELVEEVRKSTGLSYKTSIVAVETVLGHIGIKVSEVSPLLDRIFATVNVSQEDQLEDEVSSDYDRLKELFSDMTECKEDSQQRGWALHEDEAIINRNLEELLSILENAKQSVTKKAISDDGYECIYTLVQYYQMETRIPLRLILLKIFNAMCVLDATAISLLLFSILTTELAEELQRNIDDIQRSSYVVLSLAMLFSTGESVPANIHEHLNMDFLRFIFDTLENPPTSDHEEHLSDLLVNLVLAYNLHFQYLEENLVMKVIAEKTTVKIFSERILLIFNRGEDPVAMFDHEPHPPNSVMKLLQDMYSDPKTSTVLYTNDEKVLIDIILGHLVDLSPGDRKRTTHLKLMQLLITNSDYGDYKHRVNELSTCLRKIQGEEEESGDDKYIASYILQNSSHFM